MPSQLSEIYNPTNILQDFLNENEIYLNPEAFKEDNKRYSQQTSKVGSKVATAYLWLSLMRAMSRLICGATNMEDWLSTGATVDTSRHQLSQRADYLVFKKRSAEQDMFTSKEFHLQMGSSLSD